MPNTENTRECIKAFRQCEDLPGFALWQFITRETWHVLLIQCGGDFRCFTIVGGVVTPHNALQFGKLEHHIGNQVALAQFCRPHCKGGIRVKLLRNVTREFGDTGRFVVQRSQFLLEYHGFQPFAAAFQCLLFVLRPEEFRIAKTWANHALVTGRNLGNVTAFNIGNSDEIRH